MANQEDRVFQLTINTENDAFQPHHAEEIVRILRGIADKIDVHGVGFYTETVYDSNGNSVGSYALKPRREFPNAWKE